MIAASLAAAVAGPVPAGAQQPTARDLLLIARVLGFLDQPPHGAVEVGVVYPAQSAAARTEAERLAATFADGVRAGAVVLRPRLLGVEDAAASRLRVLLLTEAAVPQAATIARAVASRGVLTVTADQALVDEGLAVLAVRSQPRVEILVSRAAAQAAGIGFAGAFRMMIQER